MCFIKRNIVLKYTTGLGKVIVRLQLDPVNQTIVRVDLNQRLPCPAAHLLAPRGQFAAFNPFRTR